MNNGCGHDKSLPGFEQEPEHAPALRPEHLPMPRTGPDSYLDHLEQIAKDDVSGLIKAERSYGDSWKKRGGVGAFMMLARKWDRLENSVRKGGDGWSPYDIFLAIKNDQRPEGFIDDIRDLRAYLFLVEAEARAQGYAPAKVRK